ncbi:hypothetical protein E1B28_011997 [Marasmius oreades]|uniref:Uncharacterized protein n=1 Tax=Marasmius oreades TaxID=181124 RepID=A0A9P7RQK1_9AGAR|nr:uncharacterized protein E1B28_011997 [Marasmius oreades]KAG7087956.1 hypothetical protein E1B28_011997 [Marasmius oreades]
MHTERQPSILACEEEYLDSENISGVFLTLILIKFQTTSCETDAETTALAMPRGFSLMVDLRSIPAIATTRTIAWLPWCWRMM